MIQKEHIDTIYEKMKTEIEDKGYHFNPDIKFTKELIESLIINENRYGYMACPCRLASGKKEDDLDIICPCDYRDPDLDEFNACYCALYVSQKIVNGILKVKPIPDRRPVNREKPAENKNTSFSGELKYPVWRCRVCGYICARENPPETCPICKAKKDRFERFL